MKFPLVASGVLIALTIATAQVFEEPPSYYQLKTEEERQINNKEFPGGYPFGSARRIIVRGPFYHKIKLTCWMSIGHGRTECENANGMRFQGDGTTSLNNSNVVQACSNQVPYQMTSKYNTIAFGHVSIDGPESESGAYTCSVKAVPDGTCDCGWKTESRIVGGQEARPNSFPCMAALIGNDGTLHGGGSIISTKTILTSAHTILGSNGQVRDLNSYKVYIGRHDLSKATWQEQPYGEEFRVVGYKIYQFVDDGNDMYDIALLFLDKYLGITKATGPCCIANPNRAQSSYVGQNTTIIGWGSLEFGYPFSDTLQKGTTQVLPDSDCFSGEPSKVCTKSANGQVDSCQGDSGGPVLYFDPYVYRYMCFGVTESGVGCGDKNINERVSYYRSWISQSISTDDYLCLYN